MVDDSRTEHVPQSFPPPTTTAGPPPDPARRARQVTLWVHFVAAAGFWLVALVESRQIIGATVATGVVMLLYTALVWAARRNDLGTLDQAVQWLLERGWRAPERTFRLATADLRSAVHPSATGRAHACPQQRLDFAPATLQALERTMSPQEMTDLATDAFVKACQKHKTVFSDSRPVRVSIRSDQRLGVAGRDVGDAGSGVREG